MPRISKARVQSGDGKILFGPDDKGVDATTNLISVTDPDDDGTTDSGPQNNTGGGPPGPPGPPGKDGTNAFENITYDISFNGFRITNLGDPVNPQDAVNLQTLIQMLADVTGGVFKGDVIGNPDDDKKVVGLYGRSIHDSSPLPSQVVAWNPSMESWEYRKLSMDDITPAFTVSMSIQGANIVETGATVTNPSFIASYNQEVIAASLTDNQGTPSADVTATPTSFSSPGTFTKTFHGQSVNFILTATSAGGTIKTAQSTITWGSNTFWGVALPGQSGEAFVKSLSKALTTSKNRSITVYANPTQKVYYAHRTAYGEPTFTVDGFSGGFFLVADDILITNQYGIQEVYSLYESDKTNLGTLTISIT